MWRVVFIGLVACGRVGFDAHGTDASGAWSAPQALPGGVTTYGEEDPAIDPSDTELYMRRILPASTDLWMRARATRNDPWGAAVALPGLSSTGDDGMPRLSPNGLELYFTSARTSGLGANDIYVATRAQLGDAWSAPAILLEVSTASDERWFSPCEGGRYVLARTSANRGLELHEGVIGGAEALLDVNSDSNDTSPFVTNDCLTLYFASERRSPSKNDLYVSTRASVTDPWSAPVELVDLNDHESQNEDPCLSPDGHTLYFASSRGGTLMLQVYTATR